MAWSDLLARIVGWLRAGYPSGVPEQDYLPLLALLGRRLSDDELGQVVAGLVAAGTVAPGRVDAGVAISRLTHDLPRQADLDRVRDRLTAAGWPTDDSWRPPTTDTGPRTTESTSAPGARDRSGVESGMRSKYHHNLAQLAKRLHRICLRDQVAVANATGALLTGDIEQAHSVIDIAGEVEDMVREAEQEALRLLALQSPVARELRQVVTGIQLSTNLQRMAALAAHIAGTTRRRHPHPAIPEPVRPLISRLGAAAAAIAAGAAEVLDHPDPGAAAGLDGQDDLVDRLYEQLLATVLDPAFDHGVPTAVDLTLIGRYYERFADNAVEVGRRTIFLATGETADEWTPTRDYHDN